MKNRMLALLLLALAAPAILRAADTSRHDLGAVLAWRLGPESVEEHCRSADPEGVGIRKQALKDWLEKNAALIKEVDDRVAEVLLIVFPSSTSAVSMRRMSAKIRTILLEEIFSGKTAEETVAICKAEANPASPRWNNSGMPDVPTSLAALYDWKMSQGGK